MKTQNLKTSLVVLYLFLATNLFSQQAQENKEVTPAIPVVKLGENVTVKFGGFVRAEYYFDSRKTVGAVDDLFGFFPEKVAKDASGKDMNDVFKSNFSSQSTRFNALFSGPDVFKAKSSSFFEFDFTGGAVTTGTTTNPIGIRLRHAYIKLNWTKSELLLGKTWNPLADIIFPTVTGLNTGIPFRPFGRGDQLRFTYKPGEHLTILAAALYQSEHKSYTYTSNDVTSATGTVISNTNDMRANLIPDLHLQLRYKWGPVLAGVISEYKIVRPTTVSKGSSGTFKDNETVKSYALGGFVQYQKDKLTIQGSGLYGKNLSELFQQGGYAVTSTDSTTGRRTYTPSNSISSWVNIAYGTKLVFSLFGGYQKNLGFDDNIQGGAGTFLGRWQDIDHVYRITPTVKYNVGRMVLAAEIDFNTVAYGTINPSDKGRVEDAPELSNVRGVFAVIFQL